MSAPVENPTAGPSFAGEVLQNGQDRPYLGRMVNWLKETSTGRGVLAAGALTGAVACSLLGVAIAVSSVAVVVLSATFILTTPPLLVLVVLLHPLATAMLGFTVVMIEKDAVIPMVKDAFNSARANFSKMKELAEKEAALA